MKIPNLFKIPLDKQAHALSGSVVVFTLVFAGKSLSLALLVCALLAVAKEAYDDYHPDKHTCDVWDFVATCTGGLLAAAFMLIFR